MNTFFYGPSAVPVAILSPLVPNTDTVAEGAGAHRIENPALLHLFTDDLVLLLLSWVHGPADVLPSSM